MQVSKCHICGKRIRKNEVVVRIVVEAVSQIDDDGADPDYWTNVHEWALLHRVHLTCAERLSEESSGFDYEHELNELPLTEMVEELIEDVPRGPKLRVVHGSHG